MHKFRDENNNMQIENKWLVCPVSPRKQYSVFVSGDCDSG